jgi:hypothetical protein
MGLASGTTSVQAFSAADAACGPIVAARRAADVVAGAGAAGAAAADGRLARRAAAGQLGGLAPAVWAAEVERLISEGCHLQAVTMAGPSSGTVKCFVRCVGAAVGGGLGRGPHGRFASRSATAKI